jgi:hypothetical protein
MSVKHAKQSGLPADGGNPAVVQPSDWYADHTGAVTLLDLGTVDVSTLTGGHVDLLTLADGDYLLAIYIGRDSTVCDSTNQNTGLMCGVVDTYPDFAQMGSFGLAFLGSDQNGTTADGAYIAGAGYGAIPWQYTQPIVAGPATIGASLGHSSNIGAWCTAPLTWSANHAWHNGQALLEVGHLWVTTDTGLGGGSDPDFAGNIGGSVTDGAVTWTDKGTIPSVGSAHFLALVGNAVAP